MDRIIYNSLQLREVFHLEFLRWLGRSLNVKYYALKGGVNLRFFFNSLRYSEDMDLDAQGVRVERLKEIVMKIIQSISLKDSLKPFGIEKLIPPDISKAKQTETTQRFKIHLITFAGEDLFTKVEFSRRGYRGEVVVQPVSEFILRSYKSPPLLIPHYNISSAITQKIEAIATRSVIQARDIFDLYILSPQYTPHTKGEIKIGTARLTRVCENVFGVSFEQFRDTVISYLSSEEQATYNSPSLWDEVKLKVTNLVEGLRR